jgi:dUTP pyrophosphatase
VYDRYACDNCTVTFVDKDKFTLPIVKFIKLVDWAIEPTRANDGDVGYDVYSAVDTVVEPGQVRMVESGISVELPSHTEMQVRPRSGMAKKNGITVINTPGTIDTGYRGPCNVLLYNTSDKNFLISRGDKIAQFLITTKLPYKFVEVKSLSKTERGEGGFGSTGK